MFATVQPKATETLLLVVEIIHTDINQGEKSSCRPGSWTIALTTATALNDATRRKEPAKRIFVDPKIQYSLRFTYL